MNKIVTKEILDIYDKYEGDFGLLDEPWASKKDRDKVSFEQSKVLSEYIDLLQFVNVKNISNEIKNKTKTRIEELECMIENEVINILKERIKMN